MLLHRKGKREKGDLRESLLIAPRSSRKDKNMRDGSMRAAPLVLCGDVDALGRYRFQKREEVWKFFGELPEPLSVEREKHGRLVF